MFSIKSPVPALGFSWSATGSNERRYTLIAKLTFNLTSPVAELADEQRPVHLRDVLYEGSQSVRYPADVAPFKLHTDIIVVGSANGEPGPHDPFLARVVVGDVDKTVEILPRRTKNASGTILTGPLEKSVALRYELSYGGEGTSNPVGLDLTPDPGIGGSTAFPRIVQPGTGAEHFAVAGLGPYGFDWPDRGAGRAKQSGWFEQLPEGVVLTHETDPATFNAAPRDQQSSEISFDARIVLENLVPRIARFVTNLSWTRPIALIEHAGEQNIVALSPDTLLIDTDERIMTLTCRAQLALPSQSDDGRILIDLEHAPDATMPLLAEGFRNSSSAPPAAAPSAPSALPFVVESLRHLQSIDGESTIPGAAAGSSGLPAWMSALKQQEAQGKRATAAPVDARTQTATLDLDEDRETRLPPMRAQATPVRAQTTRPGGSVAIVPPRQAAASVTRSQPPPLPPRMQPAQAPVAPQLAPPPPAMVMPPPASTPTPAAAPVAASPNAYPPPPAPTAVAPPPAQAPNAYPPPAPFAPAARPQMLGAPLGLATPPAPAVVSAAGAIAAAGVAAGSQQAFVAQPSPSMAAARASMPSYMLSEATSSSTNGAAPAAVEAMQTLRGGDRPHSLLDASNHALRGRPPELEPAPAEPVKKAEPAPRAQQIEASSSDAHSLALGPNDALELIWFDPSCLPRVRKRPAFRKLIEALEDRPPDPDLDDAGLAHHAQELEDKRDVFEILARGEAIDSDAIEKALDDAVRADRKVVAPLVLTGGALTMPFDELETLKAYVTATTPIAASDEKLLAELAAAKELIGSSSADCAPALTDAVTQRIREAFARAKRPMSLETLRSHTDAILLQRRRYQTRDVFQMHRLRALLEPHQGATPIPIYFPQDLSSSLPLFHRFRVRLLCDVHFKVDQHETNAICLKALALARVVERRKGNNGAPS